MPRFVWDSGALGDGFGDSIRASSCEAAVESPPRISTDAGNEAGSRMPPRSPLRSPPRSPMSSQRACASPTASQRAAVGGDRTPPANAAVTSTIAPTVTRMGSSDRGVGSRFIPAHSGSAQLARGRAGLQSAPTTPASQSRQLPWSTYPIEEVTPTTGRSGTGGTCSATGLATDMASATAGSTAGTGSAGTLLPGTELVAGAVGLVSELQLGAKSLLAELQQRDSEVRLLRQALADVTQRSGTKSPSTKSLLGPREEAVLAQVPELDEQQQQQLQSVKRNLRERQLHPPTQLRPPTRRTGPCCDCETKLSELEALLQESVAREQELRSELADVKQSKILLQEELDRSAEQQRRHERGTEHKRLNEEIDQLRQYAMHSHKKRREAEADLERCRMEAEDILSRKVEVANVAMVRVRGGICPLPSDCLRSAGSYAGSERCGSESSMRTDAGAGTPDHGGLRLNFSNVAGRRSRLSGGCSPGACTPPAGFRRLRGSSCSTPPRTPVAALSEAQNVVDQMFNGSISRGASRSISRCNSRSPKSEVSAQTDQHWLAAMDSEDASPQKANGDKPVLRALNGCMPSFPSADLGEAKSSGGATRRRSCPLLNGSGGPRSPKAPPEALEVPTISLGEPALAQMAARGRRAGAGAGSEPYSGSAATAAPSAARSSAAEPVESPSQRNDHLASMAREVAKRMGSPDHWLGRSPKAGHRDEAGPKPPVVPGERSPTGSVTGSGSGVLPQHAPFERSPKGHGSPSAQSPNARVVSGVSAQPRGSPMSRSRNNHEVCRIVSMPPLTCSS